MTWREQVLIKRQRIRKMKERDLTQTSTKQCVDPARCIGSFVSFPRTLGAYQRYLTNFWNVKLYNIVIACYKINENILKHWCYYTTFLVWLQGFLFPIGRKMKEKYVLNTLHCYGTVYSKKNNWSKHPLEQFSVCFPSSFCYFTRRLTIASTETVIPRVPSSV